MRLLPFHPETALDDLLLQARNGQKSIPNVLNCLSGENLYVSSKEEVTPDGFGFRRCFLKETTIRWWPRFWRCTTPNWTRMLVNTPCK